MKQLSRPIILFLSILVSHLICTEVKAAVTIIITPAPRAQEVIVTPPGYSQCYMLEDGFYNGVWQYRHRVCEYPQNMNTQTWVSGYWQCARYLAGGRCTATTWVASHWLRRDDREYNQLRQHTVRQQAYRPTLQSHRQYPIQRQEQAPRYGHGHEAYHGQQQTHGHR